MPTDQIYVKAHYRSRGTARPKWVAMTRTQGGVFFLQSIRGRVVVKPFPPAKLQFRVPLKKYLAEQEGKSWVLLAVR